jgi:ppGpp synthetase/RelA/SpoT-type nucleotidyltranferase
MAALSNNQVDKAGRVLRKWLCGEPPDEHVIGSAIDTLLAYRAVHQYPLGKATMGLRSVVRTERCNRVEVSQRLKRAPTIIDKLARESTLSLPRMQDIGGCRAVLSSIDELRRVEARLKKKHPRASGYRGVHVVVAYDDLSGTGRRIEVQLRTLVMHEWAITVERLSGRIGQNLKGDGQHAVQELLAAISQAMALEEVGMMVDASLLEKMNELRRRAAPFLQTGGGPR